MNKFEGVYPYVFCIMIISLFLCLEVVGQNENKNAELVLDNIEKLYHQKKENDGLDIIDYQDSLYRVSPRKSPLKMSKEHYLSLLMWKVRIHHRLKETKEADSILQYMFSLNDDLDYEKFPDKVEHFENFFNRTYSEYDKGFVFVNKYKEDVATTPAALTIYTRKDIDALGARNLIDLLRLTPGFAEIGDSNERNIGTRGVYGTTVQHVLFLVNGHRVNDLLTSSSAPDWFSIDYVEQIEIMRGPGSALYGGNAFSGVINIITKSAKTFDGSKVEVTTGSAQLFDRASDLSDHRYQINYQFGTRLKNRDKLYISGTLRYSGGSRYTYTQNDQKFGSFEILPDIRTQDTLGVNLDGVEYINRYLPSYDFLANYVNEKLDITLNAQSSNFVIHRPGSSNLWSNENERDFRTRSRQDKREFIKINYNLLSNRELNQALSLKLSFDHFHKDLYIHKYASFDTQPSDTTLARLVGEEFRWTAGLQYSNQTFSLFKRNKSHTLMGLQASLTDWFYSYQVAPEQEGQFNFDPGTNFFAKNTDNENIAAFFLQSSQHIIDDRLIATLGFRLNYHPIYSNFDQFRWGDEISPRLSLVYLFRQNKKELIPFKFKMLYNSAFLPPAFLYRRGGVAGFRSVNNLESQKIESAELVVFGDATKKLKYSVNHFTNKIQRFILRQSDVYENETTIRRLSGWELGIEYNENFSNSRLETKAFLNLSTTKLKKTSDSKVNILSTLTSSNFVDSTLFYYPKFTLYGGIMGKVLFASNREKYVQFSLNFSHSGDSKIQNKVIFDDANQQWVSGQSEELTLNNTIPIFNTNAKVFLGKMAFELSVHNLLDTRYRLPSVVSRTGRMLGEKRMVSLTFEYFFRNSKSKK